MKVTPEIEAVGYGLSGHIGGLLKTTYYTPDGRTIKAIPSIREYAKKDKGGNVIEQGTRDANLDRGWLLSRPSVLKVFCRWCDRWHDTQEEVDGCKVKGDIFISKAMVGAKQDEVDKTSNLEKQVADLKALVEKLMEGKNGQIFQPEPHAPKQVSVKKRGGKTKVGV